VEASLSRTTRILMNAGGILDRMHMTGKEVRSTSVAKNRTSLPEQDNWAEKLPRYWMRTFDRRRKRNHQMYWIRLVARNGSVGSVSAHLRVSVFACDVCTQCMPVYCVRYTYAACGLWLASCRRPAAEARQTVNCILNAGICLKPCPSVRMVCRLRRNMAWFSLLRRGIVSRRHSG
jgi:hypothetical protein